MTPIRTCVGCGERAPKDELQRFVRRSESLQLDPRRLATGRGGYLHPRLDCLRRFTRTKGPVRALRWTPPAGERMRLAAAAERTIAEAR